jgi:hypothetical protein
MANPKPTITFTVNLSNKESSSLPYNLNLNVIGNETVTEAESQVDARSSWLSSLNNSGSYESGLGSGANIDAKNGDTIVAYGQNALYLKRTYAKGALDDLLTVVNVEW